MNWIQSLAAWTKELNPILQGILGSAIFAALLWLGRKFYNFIVDLNKATKRTKQIKRVTKIVIHKKFVNSNGMYYFTQGYLLVIFKALFHLLLALIFYFIFQGLNSFIHLPGFEFIASYFAIQELLNGISWLNPKWGYKNLADFDPEIVNMVTTSLTSNDPLKGDK